MADSEASRSQAGNTGKPWDKKPPCPYGPPEGSDWEACYECEICHSYSPELAWGALIDRSNRLAEAERELRKLRGDA